MPQKTSKIYLPILPSFKSIFTVLLSIDVILHFEAYSQELTTALLYV